MIFLWDAVDVMIRGTCRQKANCLENMIVQMTWDGEDDLFLKDAYHAIGVGSMRISWRQRSSWSVENGSSIFIMNIRYHATRR